jgi:hypothetical protein
LKKQNFLLNIEFMIVCIAYIGQPAMKKMGAKQAYSLLHGLSYLPLCFLGFSSVLISVIAVVAINPIVVSLLNNEKKTRNCLYFFL